MQAVSAPWPVADRAGLLAWLERTGNRLPDPAMLFALGSLLVMLLSQLAASLSWTVTKTVLGPDGLQTETVTAVGHLTLCLSPHRGWSED